MIKKSKTGNVETFHAEDSDMVPDMSHKSFFDPDVENPHVEACKEWLRRRLSSFSPSVISDKEFVEDCGVNNLVKLGRAFDEMIIDGEVEVVEDGYILNGTKGGDYVKVKVKNKFSYDDTEYEEGDVVDLPDDFGKTAIKKDFAEEYVEEKDEEEDEEEEEAPSLEDAAPSLEEETEDTKEMKKKAKGEEEEEEQERPDESEVERMKRKAKEETPTPPHWNPSTEDWLIGKVVSTGQGKKQGENRFAEVEVREGPVDAKKKVGKDDKGQNKYETIEANVGDTVLLWERKTLEDMFDQLKAGMKLAVQFTGTKDSGKGNPTMLFDWHIE